MDLWIRSQDKYILKKVNGVVLAQSGKFFAIYPTEKELGELEFLGYYKTEERAFEVLNEIQKLLIPNIIALGNKISNNVYNDFDNLSNCYAIADCNNNINIKELSTVVYEMPKE